MRRTSSVTRVIFAAAAAVVGGSGLAQAQVPTVDGTLDSGLYTRFSTQTVQTGFGDNQSELNAGYFRIEGAKLYLMLTGNVESNFNKFVVFFDTRAGGQNVLRGDNPDVDFNNLNRRYGPQPSVDIPNPMPNQPPTGTEPAPGFTFDSGFAPDYTFFYSRNASEAFLNFSELNTAGGGTGGFLGGVLTPNPNQQGAGTVGGAGGLPVVEFGYNDANTLGVGGGSAAADPVAAEAVTTGTEFSIDLAALGIEGDFRLLTLINGSNHDFVSNQFLPGLAAPQANLGGDGIGRFRPITGSGDGSVGLINLNNVPGNQFVTIPYTAPSSTWALNVGGNWSIAGNWTGGVPNGPTGRAVLGGTAAGVRVVTLDVPVQLFSLTFDSASGYEISEPAAVNTLTITGNPASPSVRVLSGSHVISSPLVLGTATRIDVAGSARLAVTGPVTAANRDIFKLGGGVLDLPATAVNSVSVNGGTFRQTGPNAALAKMRGLTIDAGTSYVLASGSVLAIDYDTGFNPLSTLLGKIAANELTTANVPGAVVGWLDSARSPDEVAAIDQATDATNLVFRRVLPGDANLDLSVNFPDLVTLARNYNQAERVWGEGDFTRDGTVNFPDLVALARNYNLSLTATDLAELTDLGGASFASDFALAQSLVPEPATAAVLAGSAAVLLGRRRK